MTKVKRRPVRGLNAGKSADKVLEEAFECLDSEDGERAERLFRKLLASGTDSVVIRTGLAEALYLQGNMLDGDDEIEQAIRLADSEEEKARMLAVRANLVHNAGYPEAAVQSYMRICEEYPRYAARFSFVLAMALAGQGREKEAWVWFKDKLSEPEKLSDTEIAYYSLAWIELMLETSRMESKDKLTKLFKRAASKIDSPEERGLLASELSFRAVRFLDEMRYREAELFVDLALFVDSSSQLMVDVKRELKDLIKVHSEIELMSRDESVFPLVTLRAMEWFFQDDYGDIAEQLLDDLPDEIVEMLYQDHRSFADGIKRMKKKYPATYAMFAEDWDMLYEDLVGNRSGINPF